jgi:hypothetical protein
MAELSKPALARLAFWSMNMVAVRESGQSWPGFSYEPSEWKRMDELAKLVDGSAFALFLLLNAGLFIVFAGIAIVAVFFPILLLLYPDTTKVEALPFTLLLATTALLTITIGLPISMRITAWWCSSKEMRAKLIEKKEDVALAKRVAWQINRITLIMCGILVPGVVLLTSFETRAPETVITLLKIFCGLVLTGIVASAIFGRKRS